MGALSQDPTWLANKAAELEVLVRQAKDLTPDQNIRFRLLYKNLHTGPSNIESRLEERGRAETVLVAAGFRRLLDESIARVELALKKSGALTPGLSFQVQTFARDAVIGMYADGLGLSEHAVATLRNPWSIGITGHPRP